MRIYYDEDKECVLVDGVYRFFANSNLIATRDGDLVSVSYESSLTNEVSLDYRDILNENGEQSSLTPEGTVDYLNEEFGKGGVVEGEFNFTGTQAETTIADARLQPGDVIYITPTVNVINEIYFPTVVNINNEFTVRRVVINVLNGLTVNMPFRWRRLR